MHVMQVLYVVNRNIGNMPLIQSKRGWELSRIVLLDSAVMGLLYK